MSLGAIGAAGKLGMIGGAGAGGGLLAALGGPAGLALMLAPSLLQGLGGLFDDTDQQAINLSKDQLKLRDKLGTAQLGLSTGDYLSRLINQRQDLQNQQARGSGVASAFGG